jgi:hypothetical protein
MRRIKSLKQIEREHAARHSGVTMEQLGEAMLRTVRAMPPDERAHLRAKLDKSLGFAPKTNGGKPS